MRLILYRFLVLSLFFHATPTTEIYTLSLHYALPISQTACSPGTRGSSESRWSRRRSSRPPARSEEHTSELQSRVDLVCRLLLEKKKAGAHPALRLTLDVQKNLDGRPHTARERDNTRE